MSGVSEKFEPYDIREIVGWALSSGNLSTPKLGRIGASHRVAALAAAPRLGSSAWRLKFAHDHKEYPAAVWKLATRASRELNLPLFIRGKQHRTLVKAAAQAVREWIINACVRCGGSGRVLKEARLAVTCDVCGGDGTRGWSTAQRARALGLDVEVFTKVWAGRLDAIVLILKAVDEGTADAVKRELGMRKRRGE